MYENAALTRIIWVILFSWVCLTKSYLFTPFTHCRHWRCCIISLGRESDGLFIALTLPMFNDWSLFPPPLHTRSHLFSYPRMIHIQVMISASALMNIFWVLSRHFIDRIEPKWRKMKRKNVIPNDETLQFHHFPTIHRPSMTKRTRWSWWMIQI